MLTQFGVFCRKLRIDNGELLKSMADKLGVTSSYLSAVETGRRSVPHEWLQKITSLYSLRAEEAAALGSAIANSQLTIKIDLKGSNDSDKNLAMAFAREFKELNEDDKSKILNILRHSAREV